MKLTIHVHLVTKLRMSGAVPLLPLHAFMVWTGKFYLYLYYPDINHTSLKPRLLLLLLLQMH